MKILVICLMGMLLVAGCKKDTAAKSLNNEITGKWELVRSFSGWGGMQEFLPGNGNTISFTGSSYSQQVSYNDTTYNYSGGYTIYTAKPCESAPETTLINLSSVDELGYPQEIKLDNGELSIGATQCIADGGTGFYRKIE